MLRASAAKGAMALGTTRIALNIGNTLAIFILARLLTPEDFGLVAICTTVLGIIIALTELSLGSALIQRREVSREHIDTAWTLALSRALLIACGFLLFAHPVSLLYGDPRLGPLFVVTGITAAFTGLTNPRVALRTKDMQFGPMMAMQVTQKLLGLAISIALALWLRNYWALVIGTAVGTACSTLLSYFIAPYLPRFSLARSKDLMGFSSWLFCAQVVGVINWRFDQLLIGLFLPPAKLGIYSVSDNTAAIPSREMTAPIVQVLFPSFSTMQDDLPRLRSAYLNAQTTLGLASLPIGIGLALVAEPFVELALGPKWLEAVPIIQFITWAYAIQTLTSGSRPVAMALGKTRTLFFRDLAGLALRVPCVSIGLAGWGLMGLVTGRLLSSVIGVFVTFGMVKTVLGIPIGEQIWSQRRTLFAVAAMTISVSMIDQHLVALHALPLMRLAVLTGTGGITFLGALALFWAAGGRRPGPETELINLARGALAKI
ncbi:lipopolysaccharide biosynthesis protein [Novosphingobium beihaiensis]|uniref:Lipopolysaccharide biosynthesis protein n=1 Tax=Novosphingobium beihaiensis TaxID=2930389 RepID=A0ABT0BTK6_9SPHN|nr:lipopolysaccharide biosynthesis protein [Novosphingobium beihaiensis]MCJ2188391.1 lipopolysaccharide biosynthesis protein [Novosphingobium beihaiensis]